MSFEQVGAGRVNLFLLRGDPTFVVTLTGDGLGAGVSETTVPFGGDLRRAAFELADDGFFPADGAELTVTLRDVAGAEVPFVLDTTSDPIAVLASGVVVGDAAATSGTFLYEGACPS